MPNLVGSVQPAPAGSLGFDANACISSETARSFVQNKFTFCVRYLARSGVQGPHDLHPAEAQTILDSGLALMAVQHVAASPWVASGDLGTSYGTAAAAEAKGIGFPAGVNVWLDLEGVARATAPQEILAYCLNWYVAVESAGYVPGLYVGASCGLTGNELYSLPFQHYWQSLSGVPAIPTRGYQMVQTAGGEIAGLSYDKNLTCIDQHGGAPLWLVATGGG